MNIAVLGMVTDAGDQRIRNGEQELTNNLR